MVIRTYVKLHNIPMTLPGVHILMNSTMELPVHKARYEAGHRICYELHQLIQDFCIYNVLDREDYKEFKSCGTLGINVKDLINNRNAVSYNNKKILIFKSKKYKLESCPRRKIYFDVYCKVSEK